MAPTAFLAVSRDLEVDSADEKKDNRMDLIDRSSLWSTRITNCAGGSGLSAMSNAESGTHWVITSVVREPLRTAIIYEPLSHKRFSSMLEDDFIRICGPGRVTMNALELQNDSWRCGYICDFLYLQQYQLIKDGVKPRFEEFTQIPFRWTEMHWLLLQLRDLQEDTESAIELGLQDFFKPVWEDNKQLDIDAIYSKLTVLILLQTVPFDSETNKQVMLDEKLVGIKYIYILLLTYYHDQAYKYNMALKKTALKKKDCSVPLYSHSSPTLVSL